MPEDIRPLRESDWEAWSAFVTETQRPAQFAWKPYYRWLMDECWVAWSGADIVGMNGVIQVILHVYGKPIPMRWQVNSYVRLEHRGHGIGQALYRAVATTPVLGVIWGQPEPHLDRLVTRTMLPRVRTRLHRWVRDGEAWLTIDDTPGAIVTAGTQLSRLLKVRQHPGHAYESAHTPRSTLIWRQEGHMLRLLSIHGELSMKHPSIKWTDYYTSSPQDFSPWGFKEVGPESAYPHLLSPVDHRPIVNEVLLCATTDVLNHVNPEDCRFTRLDGGRDRPQ